MFQPDQVIANGEYRLKEKVGEGGFGEVWRAANTQLDRDVALKFVTKVARSANLDEAVRDEGRRLARLLSDSKYGGYIIYVHRVVPGDGEMPAFLELEWMVGGDLQKRIVEGRGLAEERALSYAYQLATALIGAHNHDIVHCDIKPKNVLLDDEGRQCKLSDFGLARRLDEFNKGIWGTPPYMSPEQFDHPESVGKPSDIYSLGVLLYQCLEGRLPFQAHSWRDYARLHREEVPPAMTARVSSDLRALVMDCLAKEAGDRPTAKVVRQRIRGISTAVEVEPTIPRGLKDLQVDVAHVAWKSALPVVKDPKSGLFFTAHGDGRQFYKAGRLPSNLDFYKFVSEQPNAKWSPNVVSMMEHDGGYLETWFLGRPHRGNNDRPVAGVPFQAASDFANWVGGELPTLDDVEAVLGASDDLAKQLHTYMDEQNLPTLQFWCRDEGGLPSDKTRWMYRYIRDSRLRRELARIVRPRHFCFPHYLVLPVIRRAVVDGVLERDTGAPPSDGGGLAVNTEGSSGRSFPRTGSGPG